MNKRSYLFLAALATGLVFQQPEAQALPFSDRAPVSEAGIDEIPADEADGPADKVCFCHNITHNPHTICTANQALIQAHMDHVNGEVPGVEDSLGECEVEIETEEPCDDHEEPVDEGSDETEEPTDEGEGNETETPEEEVEVPNDDTETPEEVPADEEDEEVPADEVEQDALSGSTKVDGFEGDAEVLAAVEAAAQGPAGAPAWYFEGSGNMGCSLGGAAAGTTDLAPWALFAAVMMISPLRKIRK